MMVRHGMLGVAQGAWLPRLAGARVAGAACWVHDLLGPAVSRAAKAGCTKLLPSFALPEYSLDNHTKTPGHPHQIQAAFLSWACWFLANRCKWLNIDRLAWASIPVGSECCHGPPSISRLMPMAKAS